MKPQTQLRLWKLAAALSVYGILLWIGVVIFIPNSKTFMVILSVFVFLFCLALSVKKIKKFKTPNENDPK